MSTHRTHRPGCTGSDNDLRHWIGRKGDRMTTCRLCNWNAATPTFSPTTTPAPGCHPSPGADPRLLVRLRPTATGPMVVIGTPDRDLASLTPDGAHDLANAMVDALEAAGIR